MQLDREAPTILRPIAIDAGRSAEDEDLNNTPYYNTTITHKHNY